MKTILGHKSRHSGEIVEILARSGAYTCPMLPHYRYRRAQEACWTLRRLGLVRQAGRTPEAVNLAVTPLFREWQAAREAGATAEGPVRWVKGQRRQERTT